VPLSPAVVDEHQRRRTRRARVSARFRTRLAARPARGSTGQKGSIFPEHLLDFLGVVRLR
jgi:hypothetical protein